MPGGPRRGYYVAAAAERSKVPEGGTAAKYAGYGRDRGDPRSGATRGLHSKVFVAKTGIRLVNFGAFQFRDANGQVLSQREDFSKSKFSFVTENFNTYEICVKSFVPARE